MDWRNLILSYLLHFHSQGNLNMIDCFAKYLKIIYDLCSSPQVCSYWVWRSKWCCYKWQSRNFNHEYKFLSNILYSYWLTKTIMAISCFSFQDADHNSLMNRIQEIYDHYTKQRKVCLMWSNSFHEYIKNGNILPYGVIAMEYGGNVSN